MTPSPFILLVIWLWGVAGLAHAEIAPIVKGSPIKEKIYLSDFSPDGNTLYIDYCDTTSHCNIGQLDLRTQKLSLFFVPQGTQDVVTSPSSSDDGKRLAIVIKTAANNYDTTQIGILDLATYTYRAVTQSPTFKEWPSFSHDGKKIIYAQSNYKRTSGKTWHSDWDIYEMELATGVERRLTNFCFYQAVRPRYMTDNLRFVFSGEPLCNFPKPGSANSHNAYQRQYQNNTVFMMTGSVANLKPLVMNGRYSAGARLTRDGNKILYAAITNQGTKTWYNYDLFMYENGKNRRLTDLKTYLSGYEVSAHGERIAYLSDKSRGNNDELWIMDVAAGTHSKINFRERSSYIINQQKGD